MEILQNEEDGLDVAIWETIRSISDLKNQFEKRDTIKEDDLLYLQKQLMRATQWIINKKTA